MLSSAWSQEQMSLAWNVPEWFRVSGFDVVELDAFGRWRVLGLNVSPPVGAEGWAEEEIS